MIIRRKRNSAFTIVPNRIADDPRLTIGARWLMFYLLSKPDDWEVQIADIQRVGEVGRDKAYALVKECIAAGYIIREYRFDPSIGTTTTSYVVLDEPKKAGFPEKQETASAALHESGTLERFPEKPDSGGFREKRNPQKPFPENQDSNKKGLLRKTDSLPRTETTPERTRADLDALENRLHEAGGEALADPAVGAGLRVLSVPLNWLANGCDLDADVLPTIAARCAGRKPRSVRTWAFFTEAVIEARDRRLAVLAPPDLGAAPAPFRDPYRSRVPKDRIAEMARAIDGEGT